MLNAGMDGFVRKPYRSAEIYDCLTKQLGLRFIFQGVPTAEEPSLALTPAMMAVLPETLRIDLKTALESLESERIADVIRQVEAYDPALHKMLQQLVDTFDYPAILKVLPAAA